MKKVTVTPQLLFFVTALFGIAVAVYMWSVSLSLQVKLCFTGGCETVLSSPYAKIFGVPIAAYGVAFYSFTAIISFFRILDDRPVLRLTLWLLGVVGIFFSGYFFYLEIAKIHAICSWCKLSTLTTFVLLGLTLYELRKRGGVKAVKDDLATLMP